MKVLSTPGRPSGGPSLAEEQKMRADGVAWVAGVDEAGRGAWAGPVTAAAVVLPAEPAIQRRLRGVDDSKKLSAQRRDRLRADICSAAVAWAVGMADSAEIDRLGILPATRLAMMRAVAGLAVLPDGLLIDAVTLPELAIRQLSFNFADSISLSVAAASILAKTARDSLMCALDSEYPDYGFAVHKGYGTRLHHVALARSGICTLHRTSYKPIAARLNTGH
jgi:ribonuclease HII